jgi:hypothetical protein
VFVVGWQGVPLPWGIRSDASLRAPVLMAQDIVRDLKQRAGSAQGVGVSCVPWYECTALWGPLQGAGFQIRMSNPVTLPQPGAWCVVIQREMAVGDAVAASRLYRGRMVGYQIEPCNGRWRLD